MQTKIYLDYNASAPLKPEAHEAVLQALATTGNPSSVHWAGRNARRLVETARDSVAAAVNGPSGGVVFTSGATEANNLVLQGFCEPETATRVLVGASEHDSVLEAVPDCEIVPLGENGQIDIPRLQRMLTERDFRPTLVSIMVANNETGVVNPIAEIAEIVHAAGASLHCDGVQAISDGLVDMKDKGIDFLTLSGHKLGATRGVGAVVMGTGRHLHAVTKGGGQEKSMRSGTENIPGIASLGAVMENLSDWDGQRAVIRDLRDRMEAEIKAGQPLVEIAGEGALRTGHTSNLILPSVGSETQVIAMDLDGIAVSAGSACSSGKIKISHVLDAMGYGPDHAGSGLRVSLGWATTSDDVAGFVASYNRMAERLIARVKSG